MKNLLVFLDFTDMDEVVLKQVKALYDNWGVGKVCFLHYVELQELTIDYETQFPDLDKPLVEILEDEVNEKIQKTGFSSNNLEVVIHAKGGREDLISWVNQSEYNLCVFGKKVINPGSGIFAYKMARLLDKSILFTTETAKVNYDKVMLCVDFSSYSKRAVNLLNDFIPEDTTDFLLYHSFHVPAIYFPFVKQNSDQLIKDEYKKGQKALQQFREKLTKQPEQNTVVEYAEDQPFDKMIYNYARTHHMDLIVLGKKGKTDDDDLLIGSTAEKLIQPDCYLPVLLVQ